MVAITGFYASVLAILVIVLLFAVIRLRRRHRVGIGDGGNEALAQAIRVHANAVETIPLALILMAILESQHVSTISVHIFGALLLVGRLLHAWGLGHNRGVSFGRYWGMVCTMLSILGLAIANLLMFWSGLSS